MKIFFRLILIFSFIGFLNNLYSQDITRVTKITIEYGPTNGKEWERDTVIYDITNFTNGSFENKIIYNSGHSTPFFYKNKRVIDSCEFYKIISSLSVSDSTEFTFETYYGEKQTHYIYKSHDNTTLTSGSIRYKRKDNSKVLEHIWVDYRNTNVTIEKLRVRYYLFGIIQVFKWEKYNNSNNIFDNYTKEIKVFNRKYAYGLNEKNWECTNILKYRKSKLKWEKNFDSEQESRYYYNQDGMLINKTVFGPHGILWEEIYQYSD